MLIAGKLSLNSPCRFLIIGAFTSLVILFFMAVPTLAYPKAHHGTVVGTEFFVIQVRGDDGRVSVF
jgi:mannose/fructose/N-acetylgalactosamine-specific phosphotransferase system component IIC